MIPLAGRSFVVNISLDFPVDFFSGGHQVGKRFAAGIAMPLGKEGKRQSKSNDSRRSTAHRGWQSLTEYP